MWAAVLVLACAAASLAATPPTREELLDRAHALHERLERMPIAQRRRADYEAIADVLTQVWRRPEQVSPAADITPTPAEVALFDDGGLHIAMAQDLGVAVGWSEAAQDFHRLLRRFPATRYRRNAEWALAQIEWFHLGQRGAAREQLRDFLRRYPADTRADYARRQLRGRRVDPPSLLPAIAREPGAAPRAGSRAASEPAAAEAPHAAQHAELVPGTRPADSGAHRGVPPPSAAAPAGGGGPVQVTSLEWHTEPDGLTLVVGLSGRPLVAHGAVEQTHAVYFDFADAHFAADMANRFIHLSDPLISEIELARNHTGVIRLAVHERPGHALATVAMYFPNPSRLVVSLRSGTAPPRSAPPAMAARNTPPPLRPAPEPAAAAPLRPRRVARAAHALPDGQQSLSRALGLKVRRVVIDAGHGGFDTGAIGPNGLDEKTVTLSVALRLGRLLTTRLGAQVIYTRRTDVFVPLQTRTAIANRAHADLFISIHANSSRSPEATGVEAYYLNLTRSPRALEVAARENETTQLGDHDLKTLLQSIAQNNKRQESEDFCRDIDLSLANGLDEVNRGVKSAPFIVLIGARMPSVLAEVSFLSNPHYAHLLTEPSYRQRIALALYHGVARYIRSLGGVETAQTLAGR
ncbi:MAG: N-acetylmuramoyl-L-alanine amidase [Terriglobales bacterium]